MLDLSGYRVQMLCEDRHHGEFLRGVLIALGVNQWKIEHLTCDNLPALQEACAQFMRDNLKS